jgi:hypothetical protein
MKLLQVKGYQSKLSYDPDDVNIRLQHFRVFEVISMIKSRAISEEDFDLLLEIKSSKSKKMRDLFEDDGDNFIDVQGDDGLQRNTALWNNLQMSQFIESLMIKLPVPLFYFDGSRRPWRIIDGLQRLFTILNYIEGKFKLSGLEYLELECSGKYFNEIPGYLRSRILDAEIIGYVINPGTPPDVKYNIFKRINTGGLKLNGQEIRNAFFRGEPANFTKKLASSEIFKKATNGKISSRRMNDREFANRFIAFQVFGYEEYNGKMDVFLSEAMMSLFAYSPSDFKKLSDSFKLSITRAYQLLGGFAFYRPKGNDEWGKLPNKALFDTFSWNLNEITESEFQKLLSRKIRFKREYIRFMNSDAIMYKSIDHTTSSKPSVVNRFNRLNFFLKDFLK